MHRPVYTNGLAYNGGQSPCPQYACGQCRW